MAAQPSKTSRESADKRVGIWIRVSTEDQARGESPEVHERRARNYAELRGWTVVEVYHLEGVSGKSVITHPEALRMQRDLKSRHITGLIFSKLARLARNARELLELADLFEKEEADLVSLHESIDTSTPAGRLFYTMFAAMAQWEREEIADRVAASVPIRAKMGKPLGGRAPFGYRWHNKKLVPDPHDAPILKLLFELFLQHRRHKTVARLLNERGFRTGSGAAFSDTTIRRLIADSTSKGQHRANYTARSGKNGFPTLKPESEWVYQEVEPIFSEDLWNQIMAQRQSKPPAKKPRHLFAGLVFCRCSQKMYVYVRSPKYVCKVCRNKIPIRDLEGIYYEQLRHFLLSPEDAAQYLATADELIQSRQAQLVVLESEARKVQDHMDQTYELYLNKHLTVDGFGERYRPLEERQTQLSEEIPRLQSEIDILKISYLSSDQVLHDANDLYSRWPDLNFDQKLRIVKTITERITIDKNEIEIDFHYLPATPPFSEVVANEQHNP